MSRIERYIKMTSDLDFYYSERNKFETGPLYNPVKRDKFQKLIIKKSDQMINLTNKLTIKEKQEIENYYTVEIFD